MESTHVTALETKHAGLERQIRDEELRPAPDATRIKDLKRRKLRIKEEIALH
ncbi:YdcH family protein [Croceicoccus hydrothermalis]|uniref:YdcH family protein n=1 Tax=Croceicoccus hydrothermalis TaxID=2867964 RepID=UPI001EFBBA92|nr:YdcH family protein [Croceicoccus hydrothermalis]